MDAVDWLRSVLLLAGGSMFVIGSLGLLRFPDSYTRLHALTKVDNLGLGLVVMGLLPAAASVSVALKLLLIWLLALAAAAVNAQLLASAVYTHEADGFDIESEPRPERHDSGGTSVD